MPSDRRVSFPRQRGEQMLGRIDVISFLERINLSRSMVLLHSSMAMVQAGREDLKALSCQRTFFKLLE